MEKLLYETAGPVATVTINRPERRNAMNLETLDALHEAWVAAERDGAVRAVILTGAGDRAFSAGADLKEFAPPAERGRVGATHQAFFPEQVLGKPIIAAVNGACVAGGLELLLACDIRISVPDAVFGLPEPKRGLFPAGGSAVRAPRRLGWAAAMELLLTGEYMDAEWALRFGLVTRVVPRERLMEEAQAVAERIAANSPVAVRAIKECALETDGLKLTLAFDRQSRYSQRVHASPDAAEGMRAFQEGRDPTF